MKSVLWDWLILIGMGLIIGGIWWIYPPAALIFAGIGFLITGALGAIRWGSSTDS